MRTITCKGDQTMEALPYNCLGLSDEDNLTCDQASLFLRRLIAG